MIVNRLQEFTEAVNAKDVNYPPKRSLKKYGLNRVQGNGERLREDAWTKQAEQVVRLSRCALE